MLLLAGVLGCTWELIWAWLEGILPLNNACCERQRASAYVWNTQAVF